MLSKLLIAATLIGFAANTHAEEAQAPKTWKDKLILNYHGEYGIMRTNYGLGDLKNFTRFHNPTIGWRFGNDFTLTTSHELRYANLPRAKFVNRFYRSLVTLTKSNILTEKEDGIKADFYIARRYFDRTAVPSTYGNNRWGAILTKTWGENSISLNAMYLQNHIKTLTGSDWKDGFEIIPTFNLQLTDKLTFMMTDDILMNNEAEKGHANSTYFLHEFTFAYFSYKVNDQINPYLQLKYNHLNDFDFGGRKDNFEYYIGTSYTLNPHLTLTAELGAEFVNGSDNKTISEKWNKPEIVFYVDASF